MKFSQRIGVTPATKIVQVCSIDEELRNTLWSVLTVSYWDKFNRNKWDSMGSRADYISGSNLGPLFTALWFEYFKKPIDTIPTYFYGDKAGLAILRSYFFNAEWHEVYDFVEFVSIYGPQEWRHKFVDGCNDSLERENSGYRFVDGKIIEISSSEEVSEIEAAIEKSTPYYGVNQHLRQAITLMGDKNNPDYRNSIKESISAIGALCKTVSANEKAALGEALKILEKKGSIHPALKKAFSSLYGYTSDADGIRHPLMEESNLTSADARFMLIICSAFINYVIVHVEKNRVAQ